MDADEPERGADIFCPELGLDDAKGLQGDLLGLVELGASRRPQAHLQLAVIRTREDFATQLGSEQSDERESADESGEDDGLLAGQYAVEQRGIAGLESVEEADLMRGAVLKEPDGEDRQERRGEHVRGNHAEADGERKRKEQRAGRTLHKERRQEDGDDACHGEETRSGSLADGVAHSEGDGAAFLAFLLDGFDGHGGFIHEDAHGQGESAQGHEVDGLPAEPQAEYGDE